MTRIDDLKQNETRQLVDRVKKLETASGIGNTSVSKGALEIRGAAGLVVTGSGGMVVEGSAAVAGTMNVTGTSNVSGTMNVTGALNGSGPLDWTGASFLRGATAIEGSCTISNNLLVQGATTLTSQLTITDPGKIVAGVLEISPNFSGGGGGISTTSGRLGLTGFTNVNVLAANNIELVSGDGVVVSGAGLRVAAGGVLVQSGGLSITGGNFSTAAAALFPGVSTTTDPTNVRLNTTNGSLQRVTSSERFKDDITPIELDPALLSVPVVDWVEKGDTSGRRVAGAIAERVEEAGGKPFVEYDADGIVVGLAYDRFALARTQLLADENNALRDDVEELKRQVAELRTLIHSNKS